MTFKDDALSEGCMMRLRIWSMRFLALLIPFLVLTACSADNKPVIKPKVFDEAGLLKKKTIRSIETKFLLPPDIPLYIRTVKAIDITKVAAVPNEMMENENYWNEIRPKSWLTKRFLADPSYGTGIYILISEKPRLLQIRFGPQIRMEAYRAGLAAGTQYLIYQNQYATGNVNKTVLEVVGWLQESMPKALVLPWYMKFAKNMVAYSSNEFDDLLQPGNGIYTSCFLKPYLYLSTKALAVTQKPWIVPVVTAVLYWIVRLITTKLILGRLFGNWVSSVAKGVKSVSVWVLSIFLSFPAIGTVMLLSNGRLEDTMALSQLGLTLPEITRIPSSMFSIETSFFIALVAAAIKVVKDGLERADYHLLASMPDNFQVKCWDFAVEENPANILLSAAASNSDFTTEADLKKRPYTELSHYLLGESAKSSAKWFAFLLFMPKAISLYALATFALPLPLSIFSVRTTHKNYQKLQRVAKATK